MALSRRPARFESRHSMQSRTKTITQEKLDLLRAAAARVYINDEEKPSDSSTEANKATAAAGVEIENANAEEADPDHGVKLLAAAAVEMAKAQEK